MMHLLDNYYVKISDGTFALFKLVKGKTRTGEPTETEKIIGYFGTLKACLKRLSVEMLEAKLHGKAVELSEALTTIQNIEERLEKLLEEKGIE